MCKTSNFCAAVCYFARMQTLYKVVCHIANTFDLLILYIDALHQVQAASDWRHYITSSAWPDVGEPPDGRATRRKEGKAFHLLLVSVELFHVPTTSVAHRRASEFKSLWLHLIFLKTNNSLLKKWFRSRWSQRTPRCTRCYSQNQSSRKADAGELFWFLPCIITGQFYDFGYFHASYTVNLQPTNYYIHLLILHSMIIRTTMFSQLHDSCFFYEVVHRSMSADSAVGPATDDDLWCRRFFLIQWQWQNSFSLATSHCFLRRGWVNASRQSLEHIAPDSRLMRSNAIEIDQIQHVN